MMNTNKKTPKLRFKGFTDDWEQRKLNDFGIATGGTSIESEFVDGGTYKVINIGSYSEESVYNDQGLRVNKTDKTKSRILNKYDLTMILNDKTASGNIIGRVLLIDQDNTYVYNQRTERIEVDTKNFLPMFLYHMLNAPEQRKYIVKASQGNTQIYVNWSTISNIDYMIPQLLLEQEKIANLFSLINKDITLHQCKLKKLNLAKKSLLQKLFPRNGSQIPGVRFKGFTDAWEQRKLGDLYKRVNERNDGTLGRDKWISVAKMYFQDPDKVQSNNLDTRTYVMKKGDIAFEGHPNNEFKFGRFVLNDIGTGIISELFPIYRPITEYDLDFWKYAIQLERVMAPILAKSITSSGNSSNKLDHNHFLNKELLVPNIEEQKKIGTLLSLLSKNITLHQRKLEKLKLNKSALLQKLFPQKGCTIPDVRFKGFTDAWEQRKLGDVAIITGGGTPSTNVPEYWNGDIDWYSPVEIGKNRYVSKSTRKITKLGLEKSSAKLLPIGTVLFTSRAGIGNTAILQAEGCTNQGFQSITPDSKELDTYFLYTMTPRLKRYGEVTGAGSTFVEVSGKQMEKMSLVLPSLEEQKQIGRFFRTIDDSITLHQRKLDCLISIKKGLLQQLFV